MYLTEMTQINSKDHWVPYGKEISVLLLLKENFDLGFGDNRACQMKLEAWLAHMAAILLCLQSVLQLPEVSTGITSLRTHDLKGLMRHQGFKLNASLKYYQNQEGGISLLRPIP